MLLCINQEFQEGKVRCYELEMPGMAGLRRVCEGFGALPNGEGERWWWGFFWRGAGACVCMESSLVLWIQPR